MPKNNILNLARAGIRKLVPYQSARLITGQKELKKKIFLDANESPYPPYPVDKSTKKLNRYPEQQPLEILKILANLYNTKLENLLVTRGSDETIDLLIRAFCEPQKDNIIICPPTFGMYKVYAEINNVKTLKIPLLKNKQFQLNIDKLIKTAKTKSAKLIFIPSPNAPMGHLMQQEDILTLCEKLKNRSLVIADEAYIEFTNQKSMISFLKKYPNLVILRTLSKSYSMAGLRIGSCIGNPKLITLLRNILAPYPLCVTSIQAAAKALNKKGLMLAKRNIAKIIDEREKVLTELKKLPFIKKIFPTSTNFIFFQAKNSRDLVNYCSKKGVIIRSQDAQLKNCVRISIGTIAENKKLLQILKKYK